MSSEYRRGWEDCLDVIYYECVKQGIRDKRIYRIIGKLQASIKEDKINKLMDELGLI